LVVVLLANTLDAIVANPENMRFRRSQVKVGICT